MKKPKNEDASLDMTPMIDVVFQLIIFFVVTLKMTDNKNTEIKLEDGVHGVVLTHEELPQSQLTIDVLTKNGRGVYKIGNFPVDRNQIMQKVKERYKRYGDFPCLIRADWHTEHRHVRVVMEACTEGIGEAQKEMNVKPELPILSFVAISKAGAKKEFSLAARWEAWQRRLKKQ